MAYTLPALATLLNVLLQAATMLLVGRARGRYGIHAPAISGHPLFERAYRVQMNTLEASLMFLPTLWLAAGYGFPRWAGLVGLLWIVGRIGYAVGYLRDPAQRKYGFLLAGLSWLVLLGLAVVGIGHALLAGG